MGGEKTHKKTPSSTKFVEGFFKYRQISSEV